MTERIPRRATLHGDFAHPILHERAVEPVDGPFVVTNKRGSFVQTRRRPDGTIWAGFSEVPIGTESTLARALISSLWRISAENGWGNRCSSLGEAPARMQTLGFEPRSIIVPVSLLKEACGEDVSVEDAEKLMLGQGHVAKVGEMFVLAADLPQGVAIVVAATSLVGTYTRSDEALAIMLFRADRAIVLVDQAETKEPPVHGVA